MKKLGILVLCLVGVSSVLSGTNKFDSIRNCKIDELKKKEGDCFECFKVMINDCHTKTDDDKKISNKLIKIVSDLYDHKLTVTVDRKITVVSDRDINITSQTGYPFRQTIATALLEMVNGKVKSEVTKRFDGTTKVRYKFEKFNDTWEAVDYVIDTDKKCFDLKNKTKFFVSVCCRIADEGGFDIPAKPVNLSEILGSDVVKRDVAPGIKKLTFNKADGTDEIDEEKKSTIKNVLKLSAILGTGIIGFIFCQKVRDKYKELGSKGEESLTQAIKEAGSGVWESASNLFKGGINKVKAMFCKSKKDNIEYVEMDEFGDDKEKKAPGATIGLKVEVQNESEEDVAKKNVLSKKKKEEFKMKFLGIKKDKKKPLPKKPLPAIPVQDKAELPKVEVKPTKPLPAIPAQDKEESVEEESYLKDVQNEYASEKEIEEAVRKERKSWMTSIWDWCTGN